MEGETLPIAPEPPNADAAKPKSSDKGTLTIRIPVTMRLSMQRLADEHGLGEDPSELLKNLLLVAYMSPDGCSFKLRPVNASKEEDKRQLALPLQ